MQGDGHARFRKLKMLLLPAYEQNIPDEPVLFKSKEAQVLFMGHKQMHLQHKEVKLPQYITVGIQLTNGAFWNIITTIWRPFHLNIVVDGSLHFLIVVEFFIMLASRCFIGKFPAAFLAFHPFGQQRCKVSPAWHLHIGRSLQKNLFPHSLEDIPSIPLIHVCGAHNIPQIPLS